MSLHLAVNTVAEGSGILEQRIELMSPPNRFLGKKHIGKLSSSQVLMPFHTMFSASKKLLHLVLEIIRRESRVVACNNLVQDSRSKQE